MSAYTITVEVPVADCDSCGAARLSSFYTIGETKNITLCGPCYLDVIDKDRREAKAKGAKS